MNVLLVTADQWRGPALGCLGHFVRTPTLDALAADGVLFRRHFANCAPCGPSRASLLTGTYLHRHRSCINGTPLDARFTNIALEARKLGYRPTLFGYTDTSPDPRTLPSGDARLLTYEGVMTGFDVGLDMAEPFRPWMGWLRQRGHQIAEDGLAVYMSGRDFPSYWKFGNADFVPPFAAEESETAFQTLRTLEWLEAHGRVPWFLHLSYLRPHPPFVAPEPYRSMYAAASIEPPRRAGTRAQQAAEHPFLDWAMQVPNWYCPDDTDQLMGFKRVYYGLMTQFDEALGRIVGWLKANGQFDDTLIVFTSDHGEMMGDRWLMGKLGYFDQAFHIPLIVRDPRPAARAARGRVVEQFTESVDVLPTILDCLGAPIPLQAQGRSLAPFLLGATPARWRAAAHWEFDFRDPQTRLAERHFGLRQEQCSLVVRRSDRRKYVHFAALPPLLFDLASDPDETCNLADDDAHAATCLAESRALLSWRMTHEERTLSGIKLVAPRPIEVHEETE